MPVFSLLRRMFSRPRLLPLAFLLGGAALTVRAMSLGLGDTAEPGPGLWPACVGAGLAACGLVLIPAARPHSGGPERRAAPGVHWRQPIGLGLACVLWAGLLTPLGWMAATVAAVAVCGLAAGNNLKESLLLIILLVGGLRLGVETLLRWPLPGGTLW